MVLIREWTYLSPLTAKPTDNKYKPLHASWCYSSFVSWPFCVPPVRIDLNVTRDRNGISECKLPHCSTVGPAFPSDWLPAVELMVEEWNGERRLGNLILNFLQGLLEPLRPFHSFSHVPSLSVSLLFPGYWINDEIQSGSAITPVFYFPSFSACVTVSYSYLWNWITDEIAKFFLWLFVL